MGRYHFIAIGGSAMHNLAIALYLQGHRISGSDDEIFEPSKGLLAGHGLLPEHQGWFPEKITHDLDAVILGMHAKKDNPELAAARRANLPVYSYPEFLFQHARNKRRVVIGGSHGKTTTTAMILHALREVGIKVDFMVGARLEGFETMVSLSRDASTMILEGDEYLTSPLDLRPKFLWYQPHIAVITGIAWDHVNVFPDYASYLEQFRKFVATIPSGGSLIYCSEDAEIKKVIDARAGQVSLRPYKSVPLNSAKNAVYYQKKTYPMQVFGHHNFLNMAAAAAVCEILGMEKPDFFQAMTSFKGASGRLQLLPSAVSKVYRDFAHAPSKVKATVEAVRSRHVGKKLVAVLELHTYSSLNKTFLPHYRNSLAMADDAVVFYNPHVLQQKRLPDLNIEIIQDGFQYKGLQVVSSGQELVQLLKKKVGQDAVFLFMSSGNFAGTDFQRLFE